jgi:hypothetical protein
MHYPAILASLSQLYKQRGQNTSNWFYGVSQSRKQVLLNEKFRMQKTINERGQKNEWNCKCDYGPLVSSGDTLYHYSYGNALQLACCQNVSVAEERTSK